MDRKQRRAQEFSIVGEGLAIYFYISKRGGKRYNFKA